MNDSQHSRGFQQTRAAGEAITVLRPDQVVGKFQLVELLGHGGMGQVWKAIDPDRKDDDNHGFVVLKFLPDVLRLNADASEEFKGAYRRVQSLHHEHICPLYDVGEERSLGCFQVMQFLEGITLRTLIRQEDPQKNGLPLRRVIDLLTPIAKALDYAHRNKLIHRDIKPENIIYDPATEEVHLIDFGLAAQVRTSMSKYSQQRMSTSGTEAYMSPEQWQGQIQEAASDQWALAVVAWELLTGNLPFHGDGQQLGFAVSFAELVELPEALRHLQPVFLKGMAKDRKQRYASCLDFLKSLSEARPAAPTIIVPRKPPLLGFPASEAQVKDVQQQWSKYLNMPVVTQQACGEMVLIPPGEFLMGSSQSPEEIAQLFAKFEPKVEWIQDELPQHRVTISQPFLMGKSAITVGAFRNFETATGYVTEPEKDGEGGWGYDPDAEGTKLVGRQKRFTWRNTGWDQSDDHPVVNVTWNDASAYLEFLNQQIVRSGQPSKVFRLAREAEWEYACRAGTGAFYYNGNDPEAFYRIGNCVDGTWNEKWPNKKAIEGKSGFLFSAPTCQFLPNAFGLHDMLGNVWVWNWTNADHYRARPVGSHSALPESIEQLSVEGNYAMTMTGGCYLARLSHANLLASMSHPALDGAEDIGFRLVAVLKKDSGL